MKLSFSNLIIAFTLLFVGVFYNQYLGLNVTIFALSLCLVSFITQYKKEKTAGYWILLGGSVVSALSFGWYADSVSFWTLYLSLLSLAYFQKYRKAQLFTAIIPHVTNHIFFPLSLGKYLFQKRESKRTQKLKKMISFVVIPFFLVSFFLIIYSLANQSFADFFISIFTEFNFFELISVLIIGFILSFLFWKYSISKDTAATEVYLPNNFNPKKIHPEKSTFKFFEIDYERISGEVSLILLNFLILTFIGTYIYDNFAIGRAISDPSEAVHERVYVIIFSIVMAVALIMFYFKNTFHFHSKNQLLLTLSYIWIGLNFCLVLTAGLENVNYVILYGLTFKRLGVFAFLILCLIGLATTVYKLHFKKTNWFLFNRMIWSYYAVLLGCAFFNWSFVVTQFNLNHHGSIDHQYLKYLPFNKNILMNYYQNSDSNHGKIYIENNTQKIKRIDDISPSVLSDALYWSYVQNRQSISSKN